MLSDYQALVAALVRDDRSLLSSSDIDVAIGLALNRYSSDRPRSIVEDVVAVAVDSQFIDLPLAWEEEFSRLAGMEYPIGDSPPTEIDADRYQLYQSPTAVQILVDFVPGADPVRLSYTVSHTVSVDTDTIPLKYREAVACWGAAFLCDQLASFYAGESDSTIAADHVEDGSKSKQFAFQGKTLRARYLAEIGVNEKRAVPAGTVVDMDLTNSRGGDRLTHPNRYR